MNTLYLHCTDQHRGQIHEYQDHELVHGNLLREGKIGSIYIRRSSGRGSHAFAYLARI
jgi:hypothetical protein